MDISVIITTYNRSENLKDVFESLLKQDVTPFLKYEIIIVDNNSTDGTRELINCYMKSFPYTLRYIFEPTQGKSIALNSGIGQSNGEVIVFTDDDVVVDKDWLNRIMVCFTTYQCDALGGRTLPLYNSLVPGWVRQCKDILSGPIPCYDYGEAVMPYMSNMRSFIGANMAIKRSVLVEIGDFRVDLGPGKCTVGMEDVEYFKRLKNAGKKLYYCGNAIVYHKIDKKRFSFKYLSSWNIAYGRYSVTIEYKNNIKAVAYWGIPRYLFRAGLNELLMIVVNISNKIKLVAHWNRLFFYIGMIIEYQKGKNKYRNENLNT